MLRWLYSLLLYLLLPLVLLYFLWRSLREPAYLHAWSQRLGWYKGLPQQPLWIHAASVGEVQAAQPLVKALQAKYADTPILLTTFTPTGKAHALVQLPESVQVCFLPFDLPHATIAFLRRTQPRLAIFVETELWPNLLHACGQAQTPVLIANARLSTASVRRYAQWPLRSLMHAALANVSQVAAGSDADAMAFRSLGVAAEKVVNTGNLKFDLDVPAELFEQGQVLRKEWGALERPVWIAASTHAGEEVIALAAHKTLLQGIPNALLVLVPRHPQRFASVGSLCKEAGLTTAQRSSGEPVSTSTQVVLADTLGELKLLYATADIALVGGSLVPGIGGHNLLEPAALRLPALVGEHLQGIWQQVAQLLQAQGALGRVDSAQTLAQALAESINNVEARERAGLAAADIVQAHRGAMERTLALITSLIPPAR